VKQPLHTMLHIPLNFRVQLASMISRHGQELCPICEEIIEYMIQGFDSEAKEMINELEYKVRELQSSIDRIENNQIDTTYVAKLAVKNELDEFKEKIDSINKFDSTKHFLEKRTKEVFGIADKLTMELAKTREVITKLAEYIDYKKTINFRREPDIKPKKMSKTLLAIVEGFKENEFKTREEGKDSESSYNTR
jgi:DNA repair ATPase RecN